MDKSLKMYCVTNKPLRELENLGLKLVGVGRVKIKETSYWHRYGKGQTAYTIKFSNYSKLPFKDVVYILPKI